MKPDFFRLMLACLALCGATAPVFARDTNTDKAQIAQIEICWLAAIRTGDRAALKPILADDFIDISARGKIRSKSDAIADSAAPAGATQTITQLNVRVWGDTAVATGINQIHSNDKGWTVEVPFTDVFARIRGRWRAVSSQETLRAPKGASR
ncbi:MAG: nuclear transport factor 2 family protein [Rhodanobacteraceae bacterium]